MMFVCFLLPVSEHISSHIFCRLFHNISHTPRVLHAACFQNITLLLDASWPQFTACFQSSVLVLVPNGFLWCALLPYLLYLLSQPPGPPLVSSWHNAAKTVRAVGVGGVLGGGGGGFVVVGGVGGSGSGVVGCCCCCCCAGSGFVVVVGSGCGDGGGGDGVVVVGGGGGFVVVVVVVVVYLLLFQFFVVVFFLVACLFGTCVYV